MIFQKNICYHFVKEPAYLQNYDQFINGNCKPITDWGLQHLTALSKLIIGDDDDMVKTLLNNWFLPISLVSLTITHVSKMKSFEVIGLRHLSSLENLRFRCISRLEYLTDNIFLYSYGKSSNLLNKVKISPFLKPICIDISGPLLLGIHNLFHFSKSYN